MIVALRADASTGLGHGHLMRSLTLAARLARRGARCHFFCHQLPAVLAARIERDGHALSPLALDPDAAPSAQAEALARALGPAGCDWLVVDHYRLDRRFETALRPHARRILVIDDLADRDHDCDLLLDQNYHHDAAARYAGRVPTACRLALGPSWALLREEFRAPAPRRQGRPARLLICFGGSDPAQLSLRALQALERLKLPGLQVDLVLGAGYPDPGPVEALAQRLAHLRLHRASEALGALMRAADLALGAGGSMNWERCWLRLPSLVVALAANQEQGCAELHAAGAIAYLGQAEGLQVEDLAGALAALIADPLRRHALAERCAALMPRLEDVAELMTTGDRHAEP